MKILKIAMDEVSMRRLIRMIENSDYTHYGYKVWEEEEKLRGDWVGDEE